MAENDGYREKKKRWQKFMFGYNTVMCFSAGPPMVLAGDLTRKLMKWPYDDPVMMGIYGSIVTSVGVLSAVALKDESKYESFLPVLYTQIMYKTATCALIANKLRKKRRCPPGGCISSSGSSCSTSYCWPRPSPGRQTSAAWKRQFRTRIAR